MLIKNLVNKKQTLFIQDLFFFVLFFLATQGYRDEKRKKADKLQRQIKTCECKNKLKGLFLSSFFVAVSELIKPAGFLLYCNLQCAHTNGDFSFYSCGFNHPLPKSFVAPLCNHPSHACFVSLSLHLYVKELVSLGVSTCD